jgi:gliding motility-associated-like protein
MMRIRLSSVFLSLLFAVVFGQVGMAQKIFWVEQANNRIMAADLRPTSISNPPTPIIPSGLVYPTQIACDPTNNHIFYIEGTEFKRVNYDGSSPITLPPSIGTGPYFDMTYNKFSSGALFVTPSAVDAPFLFTYVDNVGSNPVNITGSTFSSPHYYTGVTADDNGNVYFAVNGSINKTQYLGGSFLPLNLGFPTNIRQVALDALGETLYFTNFDGSNFRIYVHHISTQSTASLGTNLGSDAIYTLQVHSKFNKIYWLQALSGGGQGIYSMDLDGNNKALLKSFTNGEIVTDFAIEQTDTQPPQVTQLTPANNATNVSPYLTKLTMAFDEPITFASCSGCTASLTQVKITPAMGATITINGSATVITNDNLTGSYIATITIPSPLAPSTIYTVTVGGEVYSDLSGNNFAGISGSAWSFTTLSDPNIFYSIKSGDWNDPTTWSNYDHTSTIAATTIPGIADVYIGAGHVVTLTRNENIISRSAGLTIESGGELNFNNQTLDFAGQIKNDGTISGKGILKGSFKLFGSKLPIFNKITFDGNGIAGLTPSELRLNVVVINGTERISGGSGSAISPAEICDLTLLPSPTNPTFTNPTTNSVTLSWTPGLNNSGGTFVALREDDGIIDPTAAQPEYQRLYAANAEFGRGSNLGSSLKPNYVVYAGTGTSVTITGLKSNTSYLFDLYSYSSVIGGCYNKESYLNDQPFTTCSGTILAPGDPKNVEFCKGNPLNASLDVDAPNSNLNLSIQWYDVASGGTPIPGATSKSFIPSPYTPKSYFAAYVDKNGCEGPRIEVKLIENPLPQIFTMTGDRGLFCIGSSVTNTTKVGLDGSEPGVNYQFFNNGSTVGGNSSSNSFTVTGAGSYTAKASFINTGCIADMIGSASIREGTAPTGTGIIAGAQSICADTQQSYVVSGITGAQTYKWELPSGASFVNPTTTAAASVTFANGGTATLKVTGENTCGSGTSASLEVQVDKPVVSIVARPTGEILVDDPVEFSYTSSTTIKTRQWDFGDGGSAGGAMETHTYMAIGPYTVKLTATTNKDCPATAELPIRVVPLGLTTDKIKNAVTINNDKANDFLIIENIEKIPNTEVTLLDRWGVEVFAAKNYKNDWDLKKDGNYLPAGNYVCVVKLNDTGKVYSRTVTVIKGK